MWGVAAVAAIPIVALVALDLAVLRIPGYGFLTFLGVLAALQLCHLGEHVVQVTQLYVFNGDTDRAHGVLTRLDQELVHVVWTSTVWLGVGVLAWRFRHNRWLWIALAVASVHEVEHLYLFYVSRFEPGVALHGGVNGILARGGLVGGPLQRPYAHFVYNTLEVLPLLAAFEDEAMAAVTRRGDEDGVHTGRRRRSGDSCRAAATTVAP